MQGCFARKGGIMYSSALKPFVFNASDLAFILSQINFRPLFDAAGNAIINWNGTGAIFDGDGLNKNSFQ